MKTNLEVLSNLLACAISASGEYDEASRTAVLEISDALELEETALLNAVESACAKLDNMDDEALEQFLEDNVEKVDDEEAGVVFEAALQIVLCDGVLALGEAELLHGLGGLLGFSAAMISLLIADVIKSEPELEVDFDDEEE